eukprot:2143249-Amphidinium_carterae.1
MGGGDTKVCLSSSIPRGTTKKQLDGFSHRQWLNFRVRAYPIAYARRHFFVEVDSMKQGSCMFAAEVCSCRYQVKLPADIFIAPRTIRCFTMAGVIHRTFVSRA